MICIPRLLCSGKGNYNFTRQCQNFLRNNKYRCCFVHIRILLICPKTILNLLLLRIPSAASSFLQIRWFLLCPSAWFLSGYRCMAVLQWTRIPLVTKCGKSWAVWLGHQEVSMLGYSHKHVLRWDFSSLGFWICGLQYPSILRCLIRPCLPHLYQMSFHESIILQLESEGRIQSLHHDPCLSDACCLSLPADSAYLSSLIYFKQNNFPSNPFFLSCLMLSLIS